MGSVQPVGRICVLTVGVLMVSALGAGATFDLGLSPSELIIDEPQQPGERFYGEFFVVSGSDDPISVSLRTRTGSIRDIQRIKPEAVEMFSEQDCPECISILSGDGALQRGGDSPNVNQWKQVAFFVNLPDDIEPGYHILEVSPLPEQQTGGGGIGVVSAPSIPVVFEVTGEAERSGKVIGTRTGRNTGDQQRVISTFHNTGTVTIEVDVAFTAQTASGNQTVQAGSRTVGPGQTAEFTADIPTAGLNETFTVETRAEYTTGHVVRTDTVRQESPQAAAATVPGGTGEQGRSSLIFVLIVVLLSSAISWQVIQRVR